MKHELQECFVHEVTHLLLRFDEHRYAHYVDPVSASNDMNFGLTAITLSRSSATVVLHSLVVAAEILALRRDQGRDDGVHGQTTTVVSNAQLCVTDLLTRSDLACHYTSRATMLIKRAAAAIQPVPEGMGR